MLSRSISSRTRSRVSRCFVTGWAVVNAFAFLGVAAGAAAAIVDAS